MPKRKYTAEFKSRIIIAILQGEKNLMSYVLKTI